MGDALEDWLNEATTKFAEQVDRDILDTMLWEITVEDKADWHMVQLQWEKGKDSEYFWNEACAWAIEQFGLPGEKYVTHPTRDYMDFLFKNKEDAILMTLKWI